MPPKQRGQLSFDFSAVAGPSTSADALATGASAGVRPRMGCFDLADEEAQVGRDDRPPDLRFERRLWREGIVRVAGVDEAGIGPLAGPVVAAAVMFAPEPCIPGVDDSKRLSCSERLRLADIIRERSLAIAVSVVEVAEIDAINIYQAGLLAMRRAVLALPIAPDYVLTDARRIPELEAAQAPIIRGDRLCFSIAAASIIAKTHRDALMDTLDREYPHYGFARNKGYPTPQHQAAIRQFGPSPAHRQIGRASCRERV